MSEEKWKKKRKKDKRSWKHFQSSVNCLTFDDHESGSKLWLRTRSAHAADATANLTTHASGSNQRITLSKRHRRPMFGSTGHGAVVQGAEDRRVGALLRRRLPSRENWLGILLGSVQGKHLSGTIIFPIRCPSGFCEKQKTSFGDDSSQKFVAVRARNM